MIIIVMRLIAILDIGRRKESLTRRVFYDYHAIEIYCVIKRGGSNGTEFSACGDRS